MTCPVCNGRLTPAKPEIVERASRRNNPVDLLGKTHFHSGDTSITLWSCDKRHDIVVTKPITCWCGYGQA